MSNTQLLINQLQDVSTQGSLSTAYKLPCCKQVALTTIDRLHYITLHAPFKQ